MCSDTKLFSVRSDVARIRIALVQRPIRAGFESRKISKQEADRRWLEARAQHEGLTRALDRLSVQVLHIDDLLEDALAFPDARDWIVEKRLGPDHDREPDRERFRDWIDGLPAPRLADILVNGLSASPRRQSDGVSGAGPPGSIAPLPSLAYPKHLARWLHNGVVIAAGQQEEQRAQAACVCGVLNFAPFFDTAHFEFWLPGRNFDPDSPLIDCRDIAMIGPTLIIGAITERTSFAALCLLARALRATGIVRELLCVDLRETGSTSLDSCLVSLDSDCVLADHLALSRAKCFRLVGRSDVVLQTVLPLAMSFLDALRTAVPGIRTIDIRTEGTRGSLTALAKLDPVVVAPGRVVVFEEHAACFTQLEQYGIEVADAVPGSMLEPHGRGPRGLVSAVRTFDDRS